MSKPSELRNSHATSKMKCSQSYIAQHRNTRFEDTGTASWSYYCSSTGQRKVQANPRA